MTKINEKNTLKNSFEKAYGAAANNAKLGRPDLFNDHLDIEEMPLPVKEMINEILKTKYNSDMDAITQEIKESRVQHDLVEELRKEIRELHEKIGSIGQEKIILDPLISKIRDIDVNVAVCQKTMDSIKQEIKESRVQHDLVEELRKEIRELHEKIGSIGQENNQRMKVENFQNLANCQKIDMSYNSKKISAKNENVSLILSIVLGLVGLCGIGHIYLGKVQKGAGILVLSCILIGFTAYLLDMILSQNMSNLLSIVYSFEIMPLVGYFGLFIWQIFDAHKVCLKYNKYVSENGRLPLWW